MGCGAGLVAGELGGWILRLAVAARAPGDGQCVSF